MSIYEDLVRGVSTLSSDELYAAIPQEIVVIWLCLCILRPLIRWLDNKVRKHPEEFKIKIAEKILFVVLPLLFIGVWGALKLDILAPSGLELPANNGGVKGGVGFDLPMTDQVILALSFGLGLLSAIAQYFYVLAPFLVFFIAAGAIFIKKAVDRNIVLLPIDQTPVPILRSCLRLTCLIAVLSQPFSSVILFDLEFKTGMGGHEIDPEIQQRIGFQQFDIISTGFTRINVDQFDEKPAPELRESDEELKLIFGLTKKDIFGDLLDGPGVRRGDGEEELKLYYGLNKHDLFRIGEITGQSIAVIIPCLFVLLAIIRPLLFSHKHRLPYPALSSFERHFIFWVLSIIYLKGTFAYVEPLLDFMAVRGT